MDESSLLVVEDEDGNEVFSCKMDNDLLEEKGVVLDEDHDENMLDNVTYFYDMRHYEKGALVNAEVELTGEFDPSKLKIVYNETYDWYLVTSTRYQGAGAYQNGVLCFLTHSRDLGRKLGGNDSYGRSVPFLLH